MYYKPTMNSINTNDEYFLNAKPNPSLPQRFIVMDSLAGTMTQSAKDLVKALKQWCSAEYGRQAQAARALGVKPQLIANWFAPSHKDRSKRGPTADQILKIQEFLRKQPKKSTRDVIRDIDFS